MRLWVIETTFSIYESMFPILGIAFGVTFLILIPLGLFDKTRSFSAIALFVISYIFGTAIWLYSVGVAFALLGWFWLIVGLLLAGLGVVPIAFLGALFQGYFGLAFGIFLSAMIPLVIRYIAFYLEEKEEAYRGNMV